MISAICTPGSLIQCNPAGLEQSRIYTIGGNFTSEELQLWYYQINKIQLHNGRCFAASVYTMKPV